MNDKKWVAAWGCESTVTNMTLTNYLEDMTFRYVIFSTVQASAVRLRFSNLYGTERISVNKVFVAKRKKDIGAADGSTREVTFAGERGFSLLPGERNCSDEIEFTVEAGEELLVSMYLKEKTELRAGHWFGGRHIVNYYCFGDYAGEDIIPRDIYAVGAPFVYLDTIDMLCSDDTSAIIVFGDSISEAPWPDILARRIYGLGIRNRTVIRRAIGGSGILYDGMRGQPRDIQRRGPSGLERFEPSVSAAGADTVIVFHGINDLHVFPKPESEQIIAGLTEYIAVARRHGLKIYFGTLTPSARIIREGAQYEERRCRVNAWIRNNDLADGYIDFEAALCDKDEPKRLAPLYDRGDGLHPSDLGSEMLAEAVPEYILKN